MENENMNTPETEIPEEELVDIPEEETTEQQRPAYRPRPTWQIVLAWIGLGIMAVSIFLYYWQIANGGI